MGNENDGNLANNMDTEDTVVNNPEGAITDRDLDGVDDSVEDGAPNLGDGNDDGVPDRQQRNVASLRNAVDENYVTLFSPTAGSRFANVMALENPLPTTQPGLSFPVGFFNFEVRGLTSGSAAAVVFFLPTNTEVNTYYKFGPTLNDLEDHLYEFSFDDVTGVMVDSNRLNLSFVDGFRGDNDLMSNGEIRDPGAPTLLTGADLELRVHNVPVPVNIGQDFTSTYTIVNNGPNLAEEVMLNITLSPPAIAFLSVNTTQGNCNENKGATLILTLETFSVSIQGHDFTR